MAVNAKIPVSIKTCTPPPLHPHTPAPPTAFLSFPREPNNPCAFCICASHDEETALCPIGLSTTDLNVFNKTDTVDIRSTLRHGPCSKKSQLWVGELFTLRFILTPPPQQLKGSSVHLKQKKINKKSIIIVRYLTGFYPVLSYSVIVCAIHVRACRARECEGVSEPNEGSKACNGERSRSVMQPKYSAAAPAPNVII